MQDHTCQAGRLIGVHSDGPGVAIGRHGDVAPYLYTCAGLARQVAGRFELVNHAVDGGSMRRAKAEHLGPGRRGAGLVTGWYGQQAPSATELLPRGDAGDVPA